MFADPEASVVVEPASTPRRRGFVREIAEGIAAGVLSAPELAAVCLFAATLMPSMDGRLGFPFAFVGGVALSRVRQGRRIVVVVLWLVLAAVVCTSGAGTHWPQGRLHPVRTMDFAVLAVGAAWGARCRAVWVICAFAAPVALVLLAVDSPAMFDAAITSYAVIFAVVFAETALGRRDWIAAAALLAGLAAVGWTVYAVGVVWRVTGSAAGSAYFQYVPFVAVAVFLDVLVAAVAGRTARAAARDATPDGGARFVTTLARRPWRSALLVGFVVAHVAGALWAWRPPGGDRASLFVPWGLAASASTLLAMTASSAAGSFGLLAPAGAAGVAALATSGIAASFAGAPSALGDHGTFRAAVTCAALILPQIVVRVAAVPAAALARLALPLVALALALPPFACVLGCDASPWTGLAWVVVVTLTCTAVASADASAAQILAVAAVAGIAQRLGMPPADAGRGSPFDAATVVDLPCAWIVAAGFVLVGRRARSLTAVPLDHPVFTDFGAA